MASPTPRDNAEFNRIVPKRKEVVASPAACRNCLYPLSEAEPSVQVDKYSRREALFLTVSLLNEAISFAPLTTLSFQLLIAFSASLKCFICEKSIPNRLPSKSRCGNLPSAVVSKTFVIP